MRRVVFQPPRARGFTSVASTISWSRGCRSGSVVYTQVVRVAGQQEHVPLAALDDRRDVRRLAGQLADPVRVLVQIAGDGLAPGVQRVERLGTGGNRTGTCRTFQTGRTCLTCPTWRLFVPDRVGQQPVPLVAGQQIRGDEMLCDRREVQAQFLELQHVVADLRVAADRIGDPGHPAETVRPACGGMAQHAAVGSADLRVDVQLLAAESAGVRVESDPSVAAHGEQAETLAEDLEGLAARVEAQPSVGGVQ